MGTLEYNSSRPAINVDDETLAHLKVVITTKLRRQEAFLMTWPGEKNRPGRLSAWMSPSIPLILEFDGDDMPKIDPKRVATMMEKLNARGELILDHLVS